MSGRPHLIIHEATQMSFIPHIWNTLLGFIPTIYVYVPPEVISVLIVCSRIWAVKYLYANAENFCWRSGDWALYGSDSDKKRSCLYTHPLCSTKPLEAARLLLLLFSLFKCWPCFPTRIWRMMSIVDAIIMRICWSCFLECAFCEDCVWSMGGNYLIYLNVCGFMTYVDKNNPFKSIFSFHHHHMWIEAQCLSIHMWLALHNIIWWVGHEQCRVVD